MADSAYDDKKTYSRCIELGLVPLIAYNPRKAKVKDLTHVKSSNWRKRSLGTEGLSLYQRFYRDRSAVERYQSTLKELLNGRSLPVRGLVKVTRHVLLTCILSQLIGLVNFTLQRAAGRFTFRLLYHFFSISSIKHCTP